jgi:hypothetical protein
MACPHADVSSRGDGGSSATSRWAGTIRVLDMSNWLDNAKGWARKIKRDVNLSSSIDRTKVRYHFGCKIYRAPIGKPAARGEGP